MVGVLADIYSPECEHFTSRLKILQYFYTKPIPILQGRLINLFSIVDVENDRIASCLVFIICKYKIFD